MIFERLDLRTYRQGSDRFWEVRNSGILVYWPHGVGDWVFLSYILPLLEPSNKYFVTRSGDDTVALFDGSQAASPVYSGFDSTQTSDGAEVNLPHFGIRRDARGAVLPQSLADVVQREQITGLLDVPFLETFGRASFPFHSKARYMLQQLVRTDRLKTLDLGRPLKSGLCCAAPAFVRQWVESRLRSTTGWNGKRLCVVVRSGYTSTGKNWGHRWREDLPIDQRSEGEECRSFLRSLQRRDPGWVFVSMEDRMHDGNDTIRNRAVGSFSFAELFSGESGGPLPFAVVLKALLSFADLVVGVPAGPYHYAMAVPGLPVIGLWAEHFPSWYDEPKSESLHLISRNVWAGELGRRPGSFTTAGDLEFRTTCLESRVIPGDAVVEAVEGLLTLPSRGSRKLAAMNKAEVRKDFVAVTIGCGDQFRHCAELAAESCRKMTGLDTFILDERSLRFYNLKTPHHLKFHLFDVFPAAETILYFDADTIFCQRFDIAPYRNCLEFTCVNDLREDAAVISEARKAGVEPAEYFNSGLFIVNHTHHGGMLKLSSSLSGEMQSDFQDQTFLNAARGQLLIPIRNLPRAFNQLRLERTRNVRDVVVGHFRWIDSKPAQMRTTYFDWWTAKTGQSINALNGLEEWLVRGRWIYERIGYDQRPMTFHPDYTIGEGSAGRERFWEISYDGEIPVLWITSERETTLWTRLDGSSSWCGCWLEHEKMPISIRLRGEVGLRTNQ